MSNPSREKPESTEGDLESIKGEDRILRRGDLEFTEGVWDSLKGNPESTEWESKIQNPLSGNPESTKGKSRISPKERSRIHWQGI